MERGGNLRRGSPRSLGGEMSVWMDGGDSLCFDTRCVSLLSLFPLLLSSACALGDDFHVLSCFFFTRAWERWRGVRCE